MSSEYGVSDVSLTTDFTPAQAVGRGLYLLVMPNGGRYWRYNYRSDGKLKTLALGVHPDVSLDKARARH